MRSFVIPFALAAALSLPVFAVDSVVDLTLTKPAAMQQPDPGTVVREGTHFVGRTGRLNRSPNGQQSTFIFDPDGTTTKTPPMIVLQNLNLFSMESVQSGRTKPLDFRVSGTVTEYKGRNYILLDKATTTPKSPAPNGATTALPTSKPVVQPVDQQSMMQTKSSTSASPGAAAEQKMNDLLTPPPSSGQPLPPATAGQIPTIDRSTGTATVAPAAPSLTVIREGTHLINRTGRLSHTPDGQQAIFTFDSDGKTMKDPPMVVLANLKLQTMEQTNFNLSKDAHFRVSGTITEYRGRNYIELDKAVTMADVEVQF